VKCVVTSLCFAIVIARRISNPSYRVLGTDDAVRGGLPYGTCWNIARSVGICSLCKRKVLNVNQKNYVFRQQIAGSLASGSVTFGSRDGVGCDKLYLSSDVDMSVFVLHNNHH